MPSFNGLDQCPKSALATLSLGAMRNARPSSTKVKRLEDRWSWFMLRAALLIKDRRPKGVAPASWERSRQLEHSQESNCPLAGSCYVRIGARHFRIRDAQPVHQLGLDATWNNHRVLEVSL